MRDFDKERQVRNERNRQFKIGGETFTAKSGVRPEVLAAYEDISTDDTTAVQILAVIDEIVLGLIENTDDAHARYQTLRARDEDPVTLEDLQEVVQWLIQEQTGRTPTRQPSPSGDGPKETETILTDDSSLEETPAELTPST